MWALKNGQFDDLDGAAMRILIDDESSEKSPPAADGDRKDRPAARP